MKIWKNHKNIKEILKFQISHNEVRRQKTIKKSNSRKRHIEIIGAVKPKSILCIGCRCPSELEDFRKSGFKVVGIDILPSKDFLVLDAHDIGEYFKENEFDIVYSSHSLEHMYNPTKVMSGIRKVASKGAFFVLPVCTKKNGPDISHPTILDIMSSGRQDIKDVTDNDMKDFSTMNPYVLSYYKLLKKNKKINQINNECEFFLRWNNDS
jgi:ubiquinone/menaquinone biosynthesis C-methylase UbiE